MNPKLNELRKKANSLPKLPGVYLMKDKSGKIIYIGKAKSLKNRVVSYFRKQSDMNVKVLKMVELVDDFDYIICDSEYEALVLECSQIKQNQPKYNILLKDDKGYSYLKITNGDWPSLKAVFKKDDKNADYLGPYYSHYVIKSALEEAIKIFKIPECNKVFPRDYNKSRPCLNYHIGRCLAPCAGRVKKEEYNSAVAGAIAFIKGGQSAAVRNLTEKMNKASENLEFEAAARYRDQIEALKKSGEKQKVISSNHKEQDVIATASAENHVCFAVFNFKNFSLNDYRHFILKDAGELTEARTEFLKRFYENKEIPPFITIDGEINDKGLITELFTKASGRKTTISVPQKGRQLELVKMAALNAAEYLAKQLGRGTHETAALDELSKLLGLKKPPRYIEAYDISHTAGENAVAGMTVFKDGAPYKKAYRRFIIKTAAGGDDYASLKEVLTRRFNEYENPKDDGGFSTLPDLILIDGGSGQLSAVMPIIQKYGVAAFGMVKDSKHRTRAVTAGGGDISIKANRRAYTLISTIQEETHRFAIEYHRSRSTKKGLLSELLNINGVGQKRAKDLIKHFKTMTVLKKATIEELKAVVPENVAQNIYNYYN